MRFQKFKTNSYCVGGRHRSSKLKICGDITSKGSKVLVGFCSIRNGKKAGQLVIILYKQNVWVTVSEI